MSRREYLDYLQDILRSATETQDFIRQMDYEAFAGDAKTRNAVVRSLEVLGEAAKNVPDNIRSRSPGRG